MPLAGPRPSATTRQQQLVTGDGCLDAARFPAFDLRTLAIEPRSAPSWPQSDGVRLHADARSAAAAAALGAQAFARDGEVFFGTGRYRPQAPEGRRLLLHELAHVAQQATPGPLASESALEAEADRAAARALSGREAPIRLAAPAARPQLQPVSWTTGDVFVDAAAANQIKNQGGLFSGNDQAHVNVSSRGKLAYDSGHTSPEDPFRWSRLKDVVDSAHLKIAAVSAQTKFKVQESPKLPPVDRSIAEIRLIVGDLSTMGVTLTAGEQSPDPIYDLIYYDQAQGLGALSHELFGHEWLALRGAPSVHPPAGSAEEKTKGTLAPSHGITDPFGNVFSGTVRDYIARYVESLGTNVNVTTSTGQQLSVPKSPTQQAGRAAVVQAFADLHAQAGPGLTKSTYSGAMAQAWRVLCDNYDLMPTNLAAQQTGTTDLSFTREVVLGISYLIFKSWQADQQSGFRILLADFVNGRSGFRVNELSSKLEALVGPAPSPFNPSNPSLP